MPSRPRRQGTVDAPVVGRWPVAGGEAELSNHPVGSTGWTLSIDGVAQSHVDLDRPDVLEFEYVRWIAAVLDEVVPGAEPLHTVHVGVGAGTLARYVAHCRPGSRQVLLDPDRALLDLVREQLGLRTGSHLKIRAEDGRTGLVGLRDGGYGAVVRDAFVGMAVPVRLATVQYVAEVRRVLAPGGVYVVNLSDVAPFPVLRSEAGTLLAAFRHVVALAEPGTLRGRRTGNVILAASDAVLPVARLSRRSAADAAAPVRLLDTSELRDRFGGLQPLADDDPAPAPPPRPTWR